MNFLFHLYLSGTDPQIMSGNLMGDFVKGRIDENYPARIRQGIILHRKIDSFAQNQAIFCSSKERINREFGLWRGVLVDLYYDHFLAMEWSRFSETPFEEYLRQAHKMVRMNQSHLPERMQGLLDVIFEELLPSYREVKGIGHALDRMSRRVRRANPLANGEGELIRNYEGLREDFHRFMPLVRTFSTTFMGQFSD